jgi:hypothetical protein
VVCIKVLATLVIVLALSACAGAAPGQVPSVASIDKKCTETATTGDMYRYCVQLRLEQARLAILHSDDGAAMTPALISD